MGLRYKLYCAKANKVLGLARRALGPNNSEGVSTAYSASYFGIWLSGLESVFSEAHQKYRVNTDASQLESFADQRKNIRRSRLGVLKWPSLELRKKFICLVQIYKIIFGHCSIDTHMFF